MTTMLRHFNRPALSKLVIAVTCFAGIASRAQDGLTYHVKYKCGETAEVSYCRHDSDMPGYPPTTPDRDYCLVYYPDRPMTGGFTVQTSELRSDIVAKLQACGALPKPGGGSASSTQPSAPPFTAQTAMTADDYIKQAAPYFNTKDAANAIDPLKKAIALGPSATAWNDLGIAYTNLHQDDNAASAFEQAAKLDPKNVNVRLNLGYAYLQLKKYDSAVAAFREALRLKPDSTDAANELGMALEDSKHYPEAVSAYMQAIHSDSQFTAAYSNLGDLYVVLKDKDDALKIYRALQALSQADADDLYLAIVRADLDSQKPSASERVNGYANLDVPALLPKANNGDDAAMKRLSDIYFDKKDTADGLKWATSAAEKGDPELQDDLGWRYETGSGVPKNIIQARQWYTKAANQGFDNAQLHLCQSYANQLKLDQDLSTSPNSSQTVAPISGSKADIDEAFNWCERAGDQGLLAADWYMGVLNARGSATHAPNYTDAYFWLSCAGSPAATALRQKISQHLSDAQRTDLEKRASNFHPDALGFLGSQMHKQTTAQ